MHKLAFDNNIILFSLPYDDEFHFYSYIRPFIVSLPQHCTHKLQALDVGVFGPFQIAWVKKCKDCANEGNPVTQENVVQKYMEVSTIKLQNLKK